MIKLALAIGFMSVFGFVAWGLVIKILRDKPQDKKEADPENTSKKTSDR